MIARTRPNQKDNNTAIVREGHIGDASPIDGMGVFQLPPCPAAAVVSIQQQSPIVCDVFSFVWQSVIVVPIYGDCKSHRGFRQSYLLNSVSGDGLYLSINDRI